MEKVLIVINQSLLTRIDDEVKILGHGANRSAYICEALEYYLKVKRGVKGMLKKRKLDGISKKN